MTIRWRWHVGFAVQSLETLSRLEWIFHGVGGCLGCLGQEVRIHGERINGLVISPTYRWGRLLG